MKVADVSRHIRHVGSSKKTRLAPAAGVQSHLSFSPPRTLAKALFALVHLCLVPLLALNLSNKPLELLLVRAVAFLLLLKALACKKIGVLAQFSQSPFPLSLVLCLQLFQLGSLPVRVVVLVWIVRLLEPWYGCLDGQWAMVMKLQRSSRRLSTGDKPPYFVRGPPYFGLVRRQRDL